MTGRNEPQNTSIKKKKKQRSVPRCVDLVARFPEPEVSLDRIAQRAALVTCAASVDGNDDVLQAARKIRVPADVERSAHRL